MAFDSPIWDRPDLLWCLLAAIGFLLCGISGRYAQALGLVVALVVQAVVQLALSAVQGWPFPMMDLPLFVILGCTWALATRRIARKALPLQPGTARILCFTLAICFALGAGSVLVTASEQGLLEPYQPQALQADPAAVSDNAVSDNAISADEVSAEPANEATQSPSETTSTAQEALTAPNSSVESTSTSGAGEAGGGEAAGAAAAGAGEATDAAAATSDKAADAAASEDTPASADAVSDTTVTSEPAPSSAQ